ncbi:hypothetical protein DNHGIG_03080 [Collibacillus ludicampi]|uniref:Transposase n=1 Tax=Collibacillus ludicampi TaxID=2771369 RepID=A0AAV4LAA0_9BACL|nr:hypothetical protein [Collibacillus ludicampi]GIM44759.1 hypothetical protein DNHGIG_03080 [Collibacillus ludicampi]
MLEEKRTRYEKQYDLTKILQVVYAKGDTGERMKIIGNHEVDNSDNCSERPMKRGNSLK